MNYGASYQVKSQEDLNDDMALSLMKEIKSSLN